MSCYVLDTSVLLAYIASIGELKASHTMFLADCCIAGLAKQKQAILLHKDPEFEQVEAEIFQHKLLYKTPTP